VTFLSGKDWFKVLRDTPLDREDVRARLDSSPKRIAHLSDALRLALVYKLGGWYADIDVIIVKSFADNFPLDPDTDKFYISSDQKHIWFPSTDGDGHEVIGGKLANGFFGAMSKLSPFLWKTMQLFPQTFNNQIWSSGGAEPLTQALIQTCNPTQKGSVTVGGQFTAAKCEGIRLLPAESFYPFAWTNAVEMFNGRKPEEWRRVFKDTFSIDFFASSLKAKLKIMRPKFYGAKVPAYAYIAPLHCPISFHSEKLF